MYLFSSSIKAVPCIIYYLHCGMVLGQSKGVKEKVNYIRHGQRLFDNKLHFMNLS